MKDRIIRADTFPSRPNPSEAEKLLKGSTVILSTLGMLSNPTLHDNRLFDLIPFERIIVDEASQINIFDYLVRSSQPHHLRVHLLNNNRLLAYPR
jgi:hypothetical protein